MRILLDADTLLEFLLNRSEFIDKVEYLSEVFGANSSIQLYLSKPGLDKIVSLIEPLSGLKKSQQLVVWLKKRIKILRLTKAVAKKAILSSAIDYESAVEIHLAIKANLGAIVTHKPSDFSLEELNIITLSDLQQRNHLEINLSKNIKDLPAVLVINSEQISNLDKAFYHLPSYTGVEPLKPKESSHLLDLTRSSEKVSSPSGDNSSPRSKLFQEIEQILLDKLSIKFPDLQSFAQLEPIRFGGLATTLRSAKNPVDESMKGVLSSAKAYSSACSGLSTTLQAVNNSVAEISKVMCQVEKASLMADAYSLKSPISQAIAQLEPIRFGGLATTLRSVKNPVDESMKGVLSSAKAYSSACSGLSTTLQAVNNSVAGISKVMHQVEKASLMADAYSLKSPILKSIAQFEEARFSSLATERLAFKNSLDSVKESFNRCSQANSFLKVDVSFSDRSGLLSQIKSIESMQRANTLDSYLPRKN
jgi:uncharacterized protein YukE